jgi:hypothetical protein
MNEKAVSSSGTLTALPSKKTKGRKQGICHGPELYSPIGYQQPPGKPLPLFRQHHQKRPFTSLVVMMKNPFSIGCLISNDRLNVKKNHHRK